MLLKEAVDNLAYKFGKSDDFAYKKKLERDIVVLYGEILKREVRKGPTIPFQFALSLTVPMEKVETPLSSSKDGKGATYQSTVYIPTPIATRGQEPGFLFVGSMDGQMPFSFVRPERIRYRTTDFTKSQMYTYFDRRLYIFDNIEKVMIRAFFDDLIQIRDLRDKNGQAIYPHPIVIDDQLFEGLELLLLQKHNPTQDQYQPEVKIDEDQPKGLL